MVKKPSAMQKTQVLFLGQEDPLKKGRIPTPVFLASQEYLGSQFLAQLIKNLPVMRETGFDP